MNTCPKFVPYLIMKIIRDCYWILVNIETGAKKTELAFCQIAQKVLPLEKFYSSKGQNDLFQGLK